MTTLSQIIKRKLFFPQLAEELGCNHSVGHLTFSPEADPVGGIRLRRVDACPVNGCLRAMRLADGIGAATAGPG